MKTNSLRHKLIRLAHEVPELRSDLLPLLKSAGPSHERCEEGTHWNANSRKCVKVEELSDHAHKKSENVDKLKKNDDSAAYYDSHEDAAHTHYDAAAAHHKESEKAKAKGDHAKAKEHETKSKEHHDKGVKHEKKSDPNRSWWKF